MDDILDEFKAEMTELGYAEGQNITYIYHGEPGGGPQANEAEIKSLLDQKVDLLVTLGNAPAKVARQAVEDTGTPVVFVPVTNPVEEGIVASIAHPGGNVTGVQSLDPTPKAIEWLLAIAPDTKQVETAEFTLNIQLKMAEAMDFDISDSVLRQADAVVR